VTTLKDILSFPEIAKQRIGYQFDLLKDGEEPSNWKSMKSGGTGGQRDPGEM
jgi:phage-related protein